MKDIREEIIKAFREKCGNNNLNLPKKIDFKEIDDGVEICLKKDSLIKNLQKDVSAFEGWAMAIYCHYLNKEGRIILDIEKCAEEIETIKFFKEEKERCTDKEYYKEYFNKHFEEISKKFSTETSNKISNKLFKGHLHCMRFLYRVLKFKEQYDWFYVSEDLISIVKNFSEFLSNNEMINNVPNEKSKKNSNKDIENDNKEYIKKCREKDVENFFKDNKYELYDIFEKNGIPFERENDVYNQLPVGLFMVDESYKNIENSVNKKNRVFSGESAAVDLWTTYKDSEFNIIELKIKKNKKAGIVSEIFFYANYINDLIIEKENSWVLNQSNGESGYNEIKSGTFEKINAVMLVPEEHPIITEEFIKAMNDNNANKKIKYYSVKYDIEKIKEKINGQK